MNNEIFLFVYGTLLNKHKNPFAQLLKKNSTKIAKGYIYAKKYHLGEFPGIKLDSNKTYKTYGELLKITSNNTFVLSELDFYEGFFPKKPEESLFIRTTTKVFTKGNIVDAFVYEYTKEINP
ncbi:gamma-glutamylcyclotransferase family protein [Aquimarina agarilytica]|uniref:gamma-glutamylcyclotransferase family protein n=1 Tax=Aquimarina agarilytica TaxID=1087449 RepID=UPI000288F97F|nr:gamma-glutamylcyclotransferase family protein [Aquimarina agarilytica]